MKVLFMGGKNIGCGCLDYLVSGGRDIVGIVVNPLNNAKNRWYRSAREIGESKNIPVYEFDDINSRKAIELIKSLAPELIVMVYYDQIVKKDIFDIPEKGCVNLHMGLAEKYRGCYPTTWAIINGEKVTGVTLHYVNKIIDGGDIIAQKEVRIVYDDTGRTLYDKCTEAGITLFREQFPLIASGRNSRRQQIETTETKYYKRQFPSREIDFNKSNKEIYNHIRALLFEPFPPPYFILQGKKFVITQERAKDNK